MELMRSYKMADYSNFRYYIDGKEVTKEKYDDASAAITRNGSYSCSYIKVVGDRVRHYCSGRK